MSSKSVVRRVVHLSLFVHPGADLTNFGRVRLQGAPVCCQFVEEPLVRSDVGWISRQLVEFPHELCVLGRQLLVGCLQALRKKGE